MSINLSSQAGVYFTHSINIVSASFVLSLNDHCNKDITLWGYSFSSQFGTHCITLYVHSEKAMSADILCKHDFEINIQGYG